MDNEMYFTVVDDEGNEVRCEILLVFESEETGKNYIVYTDNSTDEDGNTKVYASTFVPGSEETTLSPIETEKEWAIVETIIEEIRNRAFENSDLNP